MKSSYRETALAQLARQVDCDAFQNARSFLEKGGERGPQMTVIPPGTYRINTALFIVQAVKVLDIPDNMVGIVTTKEGRSLAAGEIATGATVRCNRRRRSFSGNARPPHHPRTKYVPS